MPSVNLMALAAIRTQIESKIPVTFAWRNRGHWDVLPSGTAEIDAAIGGIPKGSLSQLCAHKDVSSGKTTFLHSLLAQATAKNLSCALLDVSDSFDPASANTGGVVLARMLWVRCTKKKRQTLTPIEQAFKCADILLQGGGFGLIVLDLADIEERLVRKVPLTTWFRFSQVVEKSGTALVVVCEKPVHASCASLVLQCSVQAPHWTSVSDPHELPHANLLRECRIEIDVTRSRTYSSKKPMQSVHPRFSAEALWT